MNSSHSFGRKSAPLSPQPTSIFDGPTLSAATPISTSRLAPAAGLAPAAAAAVLAIVALLFVPLHLARDHPAPGREPLANPFVTMQIRQHFESAQLAPITEQGSVPAPPSPWQALLTPPSASSEPLHEATARFDSTMGKLVELLERVRKIRAIGT